MIEKAEVVTLGEALVAFVAEDIGPLELSSRFSRHVVGAECNTAIGLSRLGRRAAFIGRVGDDAFGRSVLRALRSEAVDAAHVGVDSNAPTGILVRARRGGVASEVAYFRRGSAGAGLAPCHIEAARETISNAVWLHVSGVTHALSASCHAAVQTAIGTARDSGVRIALDVNLRRKLWDDETARVVLMDGIERVTTLLGNEEELRTITGEASWEAAAHALLERGVEEVVVKRGAAGAAMVRRGTAVMHAPAREVSTIDSVGAGDGFDAGYLAGRLAGLRDRAVLDLANACGALAASSIGDTTGLPSASELRHLATHPDEAQR